MNITSLLPTVGLPMVIIAAALAIAALIAVQRRKDSIARILIAIVLATVFLVVTWDWVGRFRQCRIIGGSFSYCASQ
jgi:riboflavin transporter FmnP